MGKRLQHMTVKAYAEAWSKTTKTIYTRIDEGKLIAMPEPGGGRGLLIPVCTCSDNSFPGRSLCIECKREVEASLNKK